MKIKAIALLLIVVIIAGCSTVSDEEAINNTFYNYNKAIDESNPTEAYSYLDDKTKSYYAYLAEAVKYADSTTLQGYPLIDRLFVLYIRHKFPKSELVGLDAEKFFSKSTSTMLVKKGGNTEIELANIKSEDDYAIANLSNGVNTSNEMKVEFYKVDGIWKVNFMNLNNYINQGMVMSATNSGHTENEFILLMIKADEGKAPDNSIFQPLLKR